MHICYIDESGDSQAINSASASVQPCLVIAGLFVDAASIRSLTNEFIQLKIRFYPGKFKHINHDLDILLTEIKGSDIRTDIRSNALTSPKIQHHMKFMDEIFRICKKYNVKIVSRVWVKAFGKPIVDKSVYTITTQNIAQRFDIFLTQNQSHGMIVADFRDPNRNSYVAHSIFTQKHKANFDQFPSIYEVPTFGVSNNHACLQIADLLCSAVISPIACLTLCTPQVSNVHTHPNYQWIKERFKKRLRNLQFHCKHNGINYWGITVDNPHNMKTAIDMFK